MESKSCDSIAQNELPGPPGVMGAPFFSCLTFRLAFSRLSRHLVRTGPLKSLSPVIHSTHFPIKIPALCIHQQPVLLSEGSFHSQ